MKRDLEVEWINSFKSCKIALEWIEKEPRSPAPSPLWLCFPCAIWPSGTLAVLWVFNLYLGHLYLKSCKAAWRSVRRLKQFRYLRPLNRYSSLPVQACWPFRIRGCVCVGQYEIIWEQKATSEIQVLTTTQGLIFGCSVPAVSLLLSGPFITLLGKLSGAADLVSSDENHLFWNPTIVSMVSSWEVWNLMHSQIKYKATGCMTTDVHILLL